MRCGAAADRASPAIDVEGLAMPTGMSLDRSSSVSGRLARGVGLFLFLLAGLVLAGPARAAWPDSYPRRIVTLEAMRVDMAYPAYVPHPDEARALYEKGCELKSSMACLYPRWWREDGRGDLQAAGRVFAGRCPAEPLACVVVGWAATLDEHGVLVPDAPRAAEGARAFEAACDKSYAPGCTHLGELYLHGIGVERDLDRARRLLAEGCEAEDWYGCTLLGELYESGRIPDRGLAEARELHARACDHDVPRGCAGLGRLLLAGPERERGIDLLGRACRAGDGSGCRELGRLQAEGRVPGASDAVAAGLFRTACDVGDLDGCVELARLVQAGRVSGMATAEIAAIYGRACDAGEQALCARLGRLYLDGRGVPRDVDRGLALIERGCDAGDAAACGLLGQVLAEGRDGAAPDPARAAPFLDRACEAGDAESCGRLAALLDAGEGLRADPRRAAKLHLAACDGGWQPSCLALAPRFLKGDGVKKDVPRAAALYERLCRDGNAPACATAAALYERGKGVPRDPRKGLELRELGCEAGGLESCHQAGLAWLEGVEGEPDFLRAAAFLDKACAGGWQPACEAARPIALQVRFAGLVDAAFDPPACRLEAVSRDYLHRVTPLVEVDGEVFRVLAGPRADWEVSFLYAGSEFTSEPADDPDAGERQVAESRWTVGEGDDELDLAHREVLEPGADPAADFPGDEALSPDRQGDSLIVYRRGDGAVWRRAPEGRCVFVDDLDRDHDIFARDCSAVQALLAAQLVTVCPGDG